MTDQTRTALEQPHYFPGQQLTASGLNGNLGTEWERRWTHNRALHGTGIVTGLTVTAEIGTPTLVVEAGHALDPLGHELILTAPRTLQVPALPGSPAGDGTVTPSRVVLVCRWDETPEGVVSAGTCGTSGESAWLEDPLLEFVAEGEYPAVADQVVPLATVGIASCVVFELDFARRRVLGGRPLPYVDAGVWRPMADDWEPVTSPGGIICGLRTVVDTSEAGFTAAPTYQVRLTGRRWGATEIDESSTDFMLWTPEPNVLATTSRGFEVEVMVPTVEYPQQPEDLGLLEWDSLQSFVTSIGGEAYLIGLVVDQLEWAITWVGVEGTL